VDKSTEDRKSRRMVVGMNASKQKGDRGELEAVEVLKAVASDLVLSRARRKLGAGRRDDMGDLDVFDDVTIQVKCLKHVGEAIRAAASGALVQSERAGTLFHVGMSPIPSARQSGVRWLCASTHWPSTPQDELPSFTDVTKAVDYIRRDTSCGIEPRTRVAVVERKGYDLLFVGPVAAWVDALRVARSMAYSDSERAMNHV
jgi:hypothetical protein